MNNNSQILNADYLDIVFAGRNKSYGGYALRKGYNHRALAAVAFVMLAMAATIMLYRLLKNEPKELAIVERIAPPLIIEDVFIPDLPKPLQPVEPVEPVSEGAAAVAPTEKLVPPVVVENAAVKPDDTPPDMASLKDKMVGPVSHAGTPEGMVAATTANQLSGSGKGLEGTGKGQGIPLKADEVIKAPDVMPEFPGGKEALQRFLSRNISYPPQAAELGTTGQVVLSFVVNETGHIEQIKVVKSIGNGCEQEAIRVVKSMPPWKPGIKNGKPVKVYYMLPVNYQLR